MNYYIFENKNDPRNQELKKEIRANLETIVTVETKTELFPVLGGDGTVIDAIHKLYTYKKPFFGVNCGTLGFLTNNISSSKDIPTSLENLEIITEPLLEATIYLSNKEILYKEYAVNEFALSSMLPGTTPWNTFVVKQGNRTSSPILGDKLIISSSIGSTGTRLNYNKGIPLIEHGCEAIGIQGIGTNPFVYEVIDGNEEITIDISSRSNNHMVEIDGSHKMIPNVSKIVVKYSEQLYQLCFTKEAGKNIFENKRRKLYQQKTNVHKPLFHTDSYE